jgi:deoxycytidine triphosphate deaminase
LFVHAKNYISTELRPNQVQPNTVDLSLKSVSKFIEDKTHNVLLNEKMKVHRVTQPIEVDQWESFLLPAGAAYPAEAAEYIEVPEGFIGWVCPRSTLNRNGILVASAIYDSGYKGYIGCTIYNFSGVGFRIAPETRFAHFVMAKAETVSMYDGDYNHAR